MKALFVFFGLLFSSEAFSEQRTTLGLLGSQVQIT
jgi:hypothetical protein